MTKQKITIFNPFSRSVKRKPPLRWKDIFDLFSRGVEYISPPRCWGVCVILIILLVFFLPKNVQAIAILEECPDKCPIELPTEWGVESYCASCIGRNNSESGCPSSQGEAEIVKCENNLIEKYGQCLPECAPSNYGSCTNVRIRAFDKDRKLLSNIPEERAEIIEIGLTLPKENNKEVNPNAPEITGWRLKIDNQEEVFPRSPIKIHLDKTVRLIFQINKNYQSLFKKGPKSDGIHNVELRHPDFSINYCSFHYAVEPRDKKNVEPEIPSDPKIAFQSCRLTVESEEKEGKKFTSQTALTLKGENLPVKNNKNVNFYKLQFIDSDSESYTISLPLKEGLPDENRNATLIAGFRPEEIVTYGYSQYQYRFKLPSNNQNNLAQFSAKLENLPGREGGRNYKIILYYVTNFGGVPNVPTYIFSPVPYCSSVSFCIADDGSCAKSAGSSQLLPQPDLEPLCERLQGENKKRCLECMPPPDSGKPIGLWSAIGCLPIVPSLFFQQYLFTYGIGIAGGIAFLFFLYGCFLVLTSAGNPEKLEEAKQIITSALMGLLLIIFSVLLLRIIGVDILKIPGWEK